MDLLGTRRRSCSSGIRLLLRYEPLDIVKTKNKKNINDNLVSLSLQAKKVLQAICWILLGSYKNLSDTLLRVCTVRYTGQQTVKLWLSMNARDRYIFSMRSVPKIDQRLICRHAGLWPHLIDGVVVFKLQCDGRGTAYELIQKPFLVANAISVVV